LLANLQHLFHFIFILIEKSLNILAKTSFPAQNLSNRQRMSVIRSNIFSPVTTSFNSWYPSIQPWGNAHIKSNICSDTGIEALTYNYQVPQILNS